MEELVILEINQRTKEKKAVKLIECELYKDYSVGDLIKEHQQLLIEFEKQKLEYNDKKRTTLP